MNPIIIANGFLETWDIISFDNFSNQKNSNTWEIYLMVDDYIQRQYEEEYYYEKANLLWEFEWYQEHYVLNKS